MTQLEVCSECGAAGRSTGSGPVTCQTCWSRRERAGGRACDSGSALELLRLLGREMKLCTQPASGWDPSELPSRPSLERLAAAAASAHRGEVPLIDASALGTSGLDPGRPCLLCGVTDHWPCSRWSREDVLRRVGPLRVPWRPCFGDWRHLVECRTSDMSIADYVGQTGPRPGILFDQDTPSLSVHAGMQEFYDVPPALGALHGHRAAVKPIFSAGRFNTGVAFHTHPESWLAQICGRKLWWIVPKNKSFDGVLAPWQYLLAGRSPPDALFCIAEPGQVIYLPAEWAHATWNLDDCCISLGRIGIAEGEEHPCDEVLRALQRRGLSAQELDESPSPLGPETQGQQPGVGIRSDIHEWVAVD